MTIKSTFSLFDCFNIPMNKIYQKKEQLLQYTISIPAVSTM